MSASSLRLDLPQPGRLSGEVVALSQVACRCGGLGVERGRGGVLAGALVQPGGDGGTTRHVDRHVREGLQVEEGAVGLADGDGAAQGDDGEWVCSRSSSYHSRVGSPGLDLAELARRLPWARG